MKDSDSEWANHKPEWVSKYRNVGHSHVANLPRDVERIIMYST